jgi:hypothetical protein
MITQMGFHSVCTNNVTVANLPQLSLIWIQELWKNPSNGVQVSWFKDLEKKGKYSFWYYPVDKEIYGRYKDSTY